MKTNKILLLVIAFLTNVFVLSLHAQKKYVDKSGYIKFEASEKLFEPVEAVNKSVTAVLNTDSGEFASLALVVAFRFKNSLMEEHFNENYIESETYPKAIFKGKLTSFDLSSLSNTPKQFEVDGKLELHGKEKQVKTMVSLQKLNDAIVMEGDFMVTPSDFDIEIPGIVKNKIAKEVQVTINFNLKP
ncbi:hypothetical protein MTsPCn9_05080 [Croceitalea sp. MTPC9]|uniref:YceI family protein n=1 Tax=unclassified Croceitalea TaxID=2632280 RepID=UPI002B3673EF|nr:hypothetical protein MTsPCn6_03630 [Croceitalea sp. MTPC6]GMN15572.1 hypothetical protein MTsPCn9_05080 [Croceitalea sp. MTPC9]